MFQQGTILNGSCGTPRWEILGVYQSMRTYTLFQVKDKHPELDRELYLMILSYDNLPGKNPAIEMGDLRHSFEQMIRILCGNFTFLPEPVDRIIFFRTEKGLPEAYQGNDIGLVFSLPKGFLQKPFRNYNQPEHLKTILKITKNILSTLRLLHQRQVVVQALPMHSILFSHTTYKPYFIGIDTLIEMGSFHGYNPNKASLRPDRVFCAPECYDWNGSLTPATDMYALGKLILQKMLTENQYHQIFPPENPFPTDIQNRINHLNLPAPLPRLLCLCLHPDPVERFQDGLELLLFLKNDTGRIHPKPDKFNTYRQDSSKQKPPIKKQGPWKYEPDLRLPSAALVICSDYLLEKNEKLNFQKIYLDYMYKFNITPRLYLSYFHSPNNPNPFFELLKEKYGIKLLLHQGTNPGNQTSILFSHLNPENLNTLILVSKSNNLVALNLLRHPDASKWRIFWLRKGMDPPPLPIHQLIDIKQFIQHKSS